MKRLGVLLALFLGGCGSYQNLSTPSSITPPDYKGHKYYVGFGDTLDGEMGNEVKYDVKHTHDLFSSPNGGDYIASDWIRSDSKLRAKWDELNDKIGSQDMYLQYSSGHGSPDGLAFGPTYDDIRDNALRYKAREIVVFTMACYSGNLIDSFNSEKDVWQDWHKHGRTLFAMASSRPDESSSTGPATDPDEPGGPDGSAGSAFGHALWKSLIGYADKEGNNDGKTSLQEVIDYTVKNTQEIGGHTPVYTGSYDPNLVISLVPSKEFVEKLEAEGGTKNLSDEQLMQKIRQLNKELSPR
jgi:hypothetical protein